MGRQIGMSTAEEDDRKLTPNRVKDMDQGGLGRDWTGERNRYVARIWFVLAFCWHSIYRGCSRSTTAVLGRTGAIDPPAFSLYHLFTDLSDLVEWARCITGTPGKPMTSIHLCGV